MGFVSEVETLGAIAPQKSKPSTDNFCVVKQTTKMTVMLNNWNMQISILVINRNSIISLLNKKPYLSDSRHLKGRYVNITIKMLKVEYGM